MGTSVAPPSRHREKGRKDLPRQVEAAHHVPGEDVEGQPVGGARVRVSAAGAGGVLVVRHEPTGVVAGIGPVLAIISYTDEDDAIRFANEPD